jgi:DNA-binding GntR family transcriptional regulator
MPRQARYVSLAAELRRSIQRGDVEIGGLLPTEVALCRAHKVSRHTARAALALLEDAHLIERRPGLGTRVIAREESSAFVQPLGGLAELLQYARNARLQISSAASVTLSAGDAQRLGAPARSAWLNIEGVRRASGAPIAVTSIYVADAIGASVDDFRQSRRAVTEEIERRYGVAVESISQTIRAERMTAADAAALKVEPGAPIMRTVRRYAAASGRIFVISDTRHPGDRFAYDLHYRREGTLRPFRVDSKPGRAHPRR